MEKKREKEAQKERDRKGERKTDRKRERDRGICQVHLATVTVRQKLSKQNEIFI